jgi:predicted nucleic acid-binding protein
MFTIDASVYINALNPDEVGSAESQVFLARVHQQGITVFSPTLLLVELAASVARVFNDTQQGVAYARSVQRLPGHTWLALDERLTEVALTLAAQHRLRGADAIYTAVAQETGAVLVTLDQQQLTRLPQTVRAVTPDEALAQLEGGEP